MGLRSSPPSHTHSATGQAAAVNPPQHPRSDGGKLKAPPPLALSLWGATLWSLKPDGTLDCWSALQYPIETFQGDLIFSANNTPEDFCVDLPIAEDVECFSLEGSFDAPAPLQLLDASQEVIASIPEFSTVSSPISKSSKSPPPNLSCALTSTLRLAALAAAPATAAPKNDGACSHPTAQPGPSKSTPPPAPATKAATNLTTASLMFVPPSPPKTPTKPKPLPAPQSPKNPPTPKPPKNPNAPIKTVRSNT